MKLSPLMLALALPVLSSCAVDDPVSPVNTSTHPLFAMNSGLAPLVYDVENTGASFTPSVPSFAQSPSNVILPDPFRLFSGKVDLTFGGWEKRRAEVLASIEDYEIGPKPGPGDLDESVTFGADDTLRVVVTRKSNGRSITFKSPIFLPASGSGPYPAIIGMTWICFPPYFPCTGTGSLPQDIFDSRNIARIPYFHDQATTYIDFSGQGHGNDPYFYLYPEYNVGNGNAGQYSAWSWGVSRLIDGIQMAAQQGILPIDVSHLAVTGCSYAGKMALYAGTMDERIALTIAQESGGGGMPSWRPSWVIKDPRDDVERIDNTNYTWFAQQMRQFGGDNVFKLPHDHHQLLALVAPRALLATNNLDYIWLSNPSAYISARAAQETYTELGIGDRFGFIIDGGHSHCNVPASQRPAIEAFVDRFLLGQSVNTDVQVYDGANYYPALGVDPEFNYPGWMPWSLRRDIAELVADGTLNAGEGSGLSAKLEAALASIARGDVTPALNQLNAFTNQVNAFVNSRTLTSAQATALTAKIDATVARLGG